MSDTEQITDDIEEISPWTAIWVHPRQTIDWIVNNYSNPLVTIVLIYLGGVYFGIGRAELKDFGDEKETSEIIVISLFVSGLGGLITYNAWIWAIDFCASWFGGKGNFKKTQTAFAWAMLPMVAGLILTLIGYLLFEGQIFTSETPNINDSDFLTISFWTYGIVEVVLGVWHAVLIVITISQVQRLSIIKTIASILGGFLALILPLTGIIFLMR